MNFLKDFPVWEELLAAFDEKKGQESFPYKVNNHIHTPYSFSAFDSVQAAIEQAVAENIKILGINDFYVADGYEEFIKSCLNSGIFPLLNIELIGISEKDQQKKIRINDPKNPGRIYISGKGFPFPFSLPREASKKLDSIVKGSNSQVARMVDLLNKWMKKQGIDLVLSSKEIKENYAMRLLRERHVARRLRLKLDIMKEDQYMKTLTALYNGKSPENNPSDVAGTEEELRAMLLKSGAPAFVPEDENAFLPMEEIKEMIIEAGGIPTYPLLLDGAGEVMTEFESSKEQLKEILENQGIHSVELIPLRNDIKILKDYALYFYANDFVVSFGTEHNTSAMIPLTVTAKGETPLDKELEMVSFLGAAYQAAHQYLVAQEGKNYNLPSRDEMEDLGKAVLQYYFDTYIPSRTK